MGDIERHLSFSARLNPEAFTSFSSPQEDSVRRLTNDNVFSSGKGLPFLDMACHSDEEQGDESDEVEIHISENIDKLLGPSKTTEVMLNENTMPMAPENA